MPSRAALLPACLLACAAALGAGCGGGSGSGGDPVRLEIAAPADDVSVRGDTVEIRGSVRPATATVVVAGERAAVDAGAFSARVALDAGVNVIDVLASAGSARPALAALRVRRLVVVRVPDLTGLSPDDAKARLQALGLQADQQDAGGLFDELLGGQPAVCRTDPEAGTRVEPGATVRLEVAHRC
jgi:PASTA domain/Glucodextranase, domain B